MCKYLHSFLHISWRENHCYFSVASEKTLEDMALDLGKYCFCENETFSTDCTSLSYRRQYEFCCMKTSHFFKHFHNNYALWKNLIFSQIFEISAFLIISQKLFCCWNVPWDPCFNSLKDLSIGRKVNRCIFDHLEVHFKR